MKVFNFTYSLIFTLQRGNPILKSIRNVPWEYGEIVPDYVMGATTCALFLSLRYHNLNPNYIHDRLKQLNHQYELRVLLVLVSNEIIKCLIHMKILFISVIVSFFRAHSRANVLLLITNSMMNIFT